MKLNQNVEINKKDIKKYMEWMTRKSDGNFKKGYFRWRYNLPLGDGSNDNINDNHLFCKIETQEELWERMTWIVNSMKEGYDVHINISTFESDNNGKNENLMYCDTIVVDIDCGKDGHRKESAFSTVEEALNTIKTSANANKIKPNLVVHSGGGLHVYYKFDKNLLEDIRKDPGMYKEISHKLFLMLTYKEMINDTCSPNNNIRVGGTNNGKNSKDVKKTYIINDEYLTQDEPYDLEYFKSKFIVKKTVCNSNCNEFVEITNEDYIEWASDETNLSSFKPFKGEHKLYPSNSEKDYSIIGQLYVDGYSSQQILDFFKTYRSFSNRLKNRNDDSFIEYVEKSIETIVSGGFLPRPLNKKNTIVANYINPLTNEEWGFFYPKDGNPVLNIKDLKWINWLETDFKEHLIDLDIIKKINPGGYRIWCNEHNYWISYKDNEYQPHNAIKEILKDIFGIYFPKHVVQSACDILNAVEYRQKEINEKNLDKIYNGKGIPLSFLNGTLYISKNGHTWEEGWKKENLCLYKINAFFREEMLNENYWQNSFIGKYFLKFYDDGDREILQQFLGICYVPEITIKGTLIVRGNKNSGKTATMELYRKTFYDYESTTGNLPIERWEESFVPSYVLPNVMFNFSDEANVDKKILSAILKRFISEDSTHIWNIKGKSPINSTPFFKNIIACNEYPDIEAKEANLERLILIAIKNEYVEDANWNEKFKSCKNELISFALCGLIKYITNGFKKLKTVNQKLTEDFIETNSMFADFVNSYIESTNDNNIYFCGLKTLFEAYKEWHKNNFPKLNTYNKRNKFNAEISDFLNICKMKHSLEKDPRRNKVDGKTYRGWWGLKWKTSDLPFIAVGHDKSDDDDDKE